MCLSSAADTRNTSDYGRPFRPGQLPKFVIQRESLELPSIIPGHLGHHLLSLVTHYWIDQANVPIESPVRFRNDQFPDVLSTISPERGSKRMSPNNIARGFDQLALQLIQEVDWHPSRCIWLFGASALVGGSSETINSPPNAATFNSSSSGAPSVNITSGANAAEVRTRFTGQRMNPSLFLELLLRVFQQLWQFKAQDSLYVFVKEHGAIVVQDAKMGMLWLLKLEIVINEARARRIQWTEITQRLLTMLQLPAYVNRWETVDSTFFIGDEKLASVQMVGVRQGSGSSTLEMGANNRTLSIAVE